MKIESVDADFYEHYSRVGLCYIGNVSINLDKSEAFVCEDGFTYWHISCPQVRAYFHEGKWKVYVESDFVPGSTPPRHALAISEFSVIVCKHYIYLEAALRNKDLEEGIKSIENCLKEIKEELLQTINK